MPSRRKPALLIGNGINRYNSSAGSSWEGLLSQLARKQRLRLTTGEMAEMSNTEFFDILDLAKPKEDRSSLQREFCDLMSTWKPTDHHSEIVGWARRHDAPIVTVNFDENLSIAIGAKFFRCRSGFTDFYPWSSYFSDREVRDPRSSFAVWHAHGMMRYARSIRLGLTHYMGSVQRARPWVYGPEGLRAKAKNGVHAWPGSDTWLEVLFFCPLMIFGFGFGKDENFLRWLFLERARLHKLEPRLKAKTWFVEVQSEASAHRQAFFERLGITFVTVSDYSDIYEASTWQQ